MIIEKDDRKELSSGKYSGLDYKKHIEINEKYIWKELLKYPNVKPTDKFELKRIIENTKTNKNNKRRKMNFKYWLKLLVNDSEVFWIGFSDNIADQILNFTNENNTYVFYIVKLVRKKGRYVLTLSLTPGKVEETK
jgi:hypothetical protein